MTNLNFIQMFEDHSLPKSEWTHSAHVRMAWIYLSKFPRKQAIHKIREGIKSYNKTKGGSPELYHETMTLFYAHSVHSRITFHTPLSWQSFVQKNADLMDWKSPIVEKYYSKVLLFSDKARKTFLPPDQLVFETESTDELNLISLRLATNFDRLAIGNLLVAAFSEALRNKTPQFSLSEGREAELRDVKTEQQDAVVLVAEADHKLVGTVTLLMPGHRNCRSWREGFADLRFMAIHPEYRKNGISNSLIKLALGYAIVAERAGVSLHVRREACGVAALYRSFGFKRDGSGDLSPSQDLFLEGYSLEFS